MKVHIIGPGVVGKATGSLFKRFGHEVIYTDKGDAHRDVRADFHFVCVPEAAVPDLVRNLCARQRYVTEGTTSTWVDGLPEDEAVIIRSSVPPKTTELLMKETGHSLFHNPEFLREVSAEADVIEARFVFLGLVPGASYQAHTVAMVMQLYQSCMKDVVTSTSTTTELMKLASNAYLATMISFWNEFSLLAGKLNVNSHHIGRMLTQNDPRISTYGALRHGAPYGGHCLPKDMRQLLQVAENLGIDAQLLKAAEWVNTEIEGIGKS